MAEADQLYAALAHVIRHWRLDAGISQQAAYLAAGLTKNTYIRLEDGDGIFSAGQLSAIAAIYHRKGSELLAEAESLLDAGEIPELPRSVREWRRRFG
jgi:transcriptional regulator with XRE-family HTH domain